MSIPKPMPNKPLSFRPPEILKGETRSSELPYVPVEPEKKTQKGHRANIVMVDEVKHSDDSTIEDIAVLSGDEGQRAIFDFSSKEQVPAVKKPFVLDTHLTQRPFHDDRLMQLKTRLQRPSFKNR